MARTHHRLALLVSLAVCACDEVPLRSLPKPDDVLALDGQFCTGEPYDTNRNLKVLFLVDSSSSMRWNDPNDLVVDAIEHITTRYAGQSNISFAIIRWGSAQVVKEMIDYAPMGTDPPYFINDPMKEAVIYTRMREPPTVNPLKYLDGTNFLLALGAAADYIVADEGKNPEETLTTRYLVEFLTDGMPQSATDDPNITRRNIISECSNLASRYGARVDVISIAMDVVAPPEFLGLLPAMAQAGGGTYVQLQGPSGLDMTFDQIISHGANLVEYQLGSAFAWNRQARLMTYNGKADLYVDSDGDGLIDEQEMDLGTNPQSVDTDGDGLSDLFEVRAQGGYDPTAKNVYDLGTDGGVDLDGDELTNFEEAQLGTDPSNADTDRDGVPDDIEIIVGTDPIAADATADPDKDQVPSARESWQHTDPITDEGANLRDKWAYQWAPEMLLGAQQAIRCYQFGAKNIVLESSLASIDMLGRQRPAGFNEIEVIVLGKPILGPSTGAATDKAFPVRHFRARRYVIAGKGGSVDPPTHLLEMGQTEFTP